MASSGSGSNNNQFSGVKVFSATMAQERDQLGEKITQWLKVNPGVQIVDKIASGRYGTFGCRQRCR